MVRSGTPPNCRAMAHFRRPLVLACLAFLAGAALGLRFGWSLPLPLVFGSLLAGVGLALAGDLDRGQLRTGLQLAALLAAGWAQGSLTRSDALHDCRGRIPDGARVRVAGVLSASHVLGDSAERIPTVAVAGVVDGGGPPCRGEIRVRLPRGFPAAAAGTELRVAGAWWKHPAPVLPGPWPKAGAAGFVMAREARVTRAAALRHPLLWARGRSQAAVLRLFPGHSALAEALLLNRRERLDPDVSRRFADSGLVHLLAISGSHVAMIGAVLLLLARTLRRSRRSAAVWTIVLVAAYLGLIGAPASAVRSGVMLALVLLGGVLQRPSSPVTAMAAAALTLVALDPLTLLDAGFQLSFAGVAGLCLVRPLVLRRLPERWLEDGWRRALTDSVVSSVAAFATTAPIVAYHFGQSAPVSILANLPAIPLASLALVGIAAAVVVEPLAGPVARLLADGASVCLDLLGGVADLAARVPGGHFPVPRPSLPVWLLAGVLVAATLQVASRMRPLFRAVLAAGAVAAVLLFAPLGAMAGGGGIELAFLDVGQGDAVALRTPAGRWVLIDAGPLEERYDAGERRVLPYLRARGARRVEALILSHPHADHVGGAAAVMRGIPVGRVVDPGLPFASPVYRDVLRTARSTGAGWVAARQDRVMHIDGVELVFLWPTPASLDSPEDANDISAVVQIRYGAFRALLTGDAPAWVEERLVERYGASLQSQVLKAGHHGSRTSTSDAFLTWVRPRLAVLSCGRRNRYGHPAPSTLARLRRAGIRTARTDLDGTVLLRVDPGGNTWRWENP